MPNVLLKLGKMCVQHQEVIEPENLQAHIAEFPDHYYIEAEYNEVHPAPKSAVKTEVDDHPDAKGNVHDLTTADIGAATTVDIVQIQAMIAEGMAVMMAHNQSTGNIHGASPAEIGSPTVFDFLQHLNDQANGHQVTAAQTGAIPTSEKGVPNGLPFLDANGKILPEFIPASLLPSFKVVQDFAERDALTSKEGDEAKVLDDGSNWIHDGSGWVSDDNPGAQSIFGSEYQKVVSPSVKTTTIYHGSGTSKLFLDTGVLPLGNYKIEVAYGWNANSTSSDFISFLNIDGVMEGQAHEQEPKESCGRFLTTGTSQKHYTQRVFFMDNWSGQHNLDLRFKTEKKNKEASMWDASISIMRIS
jgi:hypothetical protein